MNPRIRDGWLLIDTDASDIAVVEIALTNVTNAKAFQPAFRDTDQGKRVAMVRVPNVSGRLVVYVRVDGVESMQGMINL